MENKLAPSIRRPPRPRDEAAEPFRFERRRAQRTPASGLVTLLRRGHDAQAYRQPIYTVQLSDLSDTGAGLRTRRPVAVDEPLAVCFPPHGPDRGFDRVGHVVRCDPQGDGYHLGIQFDPPAAA